MYGHKMSFGANLLVTANYQPMHFHTISAYLLHDISSMDDFFSIPHFFLGSYQISIQFIRATLNT